MLLNKKNRLAVTISLTMAICVASSSASMAKVTPQETESGKIQGENVEDVGSESDISPFSGSVSGLGDDWGVTVVGGENALYVVAKDKSITFTLPAITTTADVEIDGIPVAMSASTYSSAVRASRCAFTPRASGSYAVTFTAPDGSNYRTFTFYIA